MYDFLLEFTKNNQFFSGGFLLGVMGAIIGVIYQIPVYLTRFYNYWCTSISITAPTHSYNTAAILSDNLASVINQMSRNNKYELSVCSSGSFKANDEGVNLNTAEHSQYFIKDWRLWRFSKTRLENNQEPYTTLTLKVLPCNQKLLDDLIKKILPAKSDKSRVYYGGSYGEQFVEKRFKRFDQIFLNGHKLEEIREDLDRFAQQKPFYIEKGIKYKRSYLFYGPPGNGKTSLSEAIASYTGKHLYKLTLSSKRMDDLALIGEVSQTCNGKVVSIEDVDCLFNDRKDDDSKVTFSAFLNFIDGVNSPDDCIFVINTNHKDKLDEALLRAGRVDFSMEIDKPNEDCAKRYLSFLGKESLAETLPAHLSMCDIQSQVLKC